MTTIPISIDDVSAAWVAEATGLAVTAVTADLIGVGIGVSSAVYRLTLTGTDVPQSLVLKLTALDEAAAFTSAMLRMYDKEVKFFHELAVESPIRVPKGYGGACGDEGAPYYLFMEDMDGHRVVDQLDGMDIGDAEQAVDELAKWHAKFWGKGEHHESTGAALSLGADIYKGVLPVVFAEGWEKVQAEMEVLPTIADVAPRWVAKLNDMLDGLSTAPTTVTHGDYRADNIFFDADGQVVLLDFQLTGVGTGAYDLAYFVTQSLLPEVASDNEQALFDRYVAGLVAAGVPEAETGRLWEDYRLAALFCLAYPVVASRGMDMSDQRQYDLAATMMRRCARAIDELNLRDLLESNPTSDG